MFRGRIIEILVLLDLMSPVSIEVQVCFNTVILVPSYFK